MEQDTTTITPTAIPTVEEMRERLIKELDLAELAPAEQDEIIISLSELLVERVAINIFSKIPEEPLAQIDALLEEGKQEEAGVLMNQHVPDAQAVAEKTMSDGIIEYKQRVSGTYVEPQVQQ
jgi:phosphopantothenate synthetase